MNSKKLASALHDLKQINQSIESSLENKASLIDIDLSLDKIRNIYELMTEIKLEILSKSSSTVKEENNNQVQTEIQVNEPTAKVSPKVNEVIPEPKVKPEAKSEPKPEPVHEPVSEPEVNLNEEINVPPTPEIQIDFIEETPKPKKEKPVQKETIKIETKKVPKPKVKEVKTEEPLVVDTNETVADQFESKKSLNDILSSIKDNDDLATQLKNSPIKDLKTAISLNDKIWFTRELFDGDNNKYTESIENFNTMGSMDEALHLANTFSWDKEEASTKHFLELIYRRFV